MSRFGFWWLMNVTVRFERRRLRRFWAGIGLVLFFWAGPVFTAYAGAEESRLTVELVWEHAERSNDETTRMVAVIPNAKLTYIRSGTNGAFQSYHLYFSNGYQCATGNAYGESILMTCGQNGAYYMLTRTGKANAELEWIRYIEPAKPKVKA